MVSLSHFFVFFSILPTDAVLRLRGFFRRTHSIKFHIGNALFATRDVFGMFQLANVGQGIAQ